jgi:hypothetical protein
MTTAIKKIVIIVPVKAAWALLILFMHPLLKYPDKFI